jgi:hypothetical protein
MLSHDKFLAIKDPTVGDMPGGLDKENVIANIMGSPTDPTTQAKMVTAVTDMDASKGHTKAPHVPVAQIHVTDVESKPDPIIVDPNSE